MEKVEIIHAEAVEAINRSEIDIQVKTAKAYPRHIPDVLTKVETLATMDTETAEDCHYALKRGKGSDAKLIEGLSVRFTEILANCWGNLRIATRIIGNDGKMVTVQGVCHDLETNVAVSVEVKRSILQHEYTWNDTTKKSEKTGKKITMNEDMQVVTSNAASAIAYRNAVLKVIPKSITKNVVEKIRKVALGQALDIETATNNMLANFKKLGVTPEQICEFLEIKTVVEIDKEKILTMKGLWNAIKDGNTSVKEQFPPKTGDDKKAALKKKKEAGKKEEGIGEEKPEAEKKEGETKPEVKPGEQGKIDLP